MPTRVDPISALEPPEDRQREIGGRVSEASSSTQGPNQSENERIRSRSPTPAEMLNLSGETPTPHQGRRTNETPQTGERVNRNKDEIKIKRKTRAHLKVASLNMRGIGTQAPLDPNNKWSALSYLIREQKIGILAIQETHLTDEAIDNLHRAYGKRLQIYHSSDPENPSQRAGVAIVVNKALTNIKGIETETIVPGRAIMMQIPWHATLKLRILAVYAPNTPKENGAFWNKIVEHWDKRRLPTPDIVLGDFNIVEDALDRLPAHADDPDATVELISMKQRFQIFDGWRLVNETKRGYSYTQEAIRSHSQIDRIYIGETLRNSTTDWSIDLTNVPTDHRLVSVTVLDRKSPYIGPGRWTMPKFLAGDKQFLEEIIKLGKSVNDEIKTVNAGNRTTDNNPQKLFRALKSKIKDMGVKQAREAIPKTVRKINELKVNLQNLQEDDGDQTEEKCLSIVLTKR